MLQVQVVHAAAAPPVLALPASALANVRTLHLLRELQQWPLTEYRDTATIDMTADMVI